MTASELQFVKKMLGTGKVGYAYFKDKYVIDMMKLAVKEEISIGAFKKSPFGFLARKEIAQRLLAAAGNGKISPGKLEESRPMDCREFHYTLGSWGQASNKDHDLWYQTSRAGWNLVLQLNFDAFHNHGYYELMKPGKTHPFVYDRHPVRKKGGFTMGWVRLDFDFDTGEVLIEEIQNDWLRYVEDQKEWVRRHRREIRKKGGKLPSKLCAVHIDDFLQYRREYVLPYQPIWDEALLNLAINFSVKELGFRKIYYHTHESGNAMKAMPRFSRPPISIYTKLPRKFGFKKTTNYPDFLGKDKRLRKRLRAAKNWFYLNV